MTLHQPEKLKFQGTALGVRERLLLALAAVPLLARGVAQKARLQAWLASVPRPEAFSDGTAAAFGASLSGDLKRLTWQASGAAGTMVPHIAGFLGDAGVPQAQMDAVRAAGQHVRPTAAGSFIEATAAGVDAGWFFPVPLTLARARAHAATGAGNDALGKWATAHGVTEATGLGHACGSDCARIELVAPDLAAGLDAFEHLDLAPPPDAAIAALAKASGNLGLSIWLGPNGLPVKLGLVADNPTTKLVVELCQAVGVQEDAGLASFQGLLVLDGASQVELQWLDGNFGVEVHQFAGADALYHA